MPDLIVGDAVIVDRRYHYSRLVDMQRSRGMRQNRLQLLRHTRLGVISVCSGVAELRDFTDYHYCTYLSDLPSTLTITARHGES